MIDIARSRSVVTLHIQALEAGLDQEMPRSVYFNTHQLDQHSPRIDDAATRVLTVMLKLDVLNNPPTGGATRREPLCVRCVR